MNKLLAAQSFKIFLLGWGMVFTYVALNSAGSLLLKSQVQRIGSWNMNSIHSVFSFFYALFVSWQALIGLIFISLATGAWIIALAHLDISKAYPAAIGFNLIVIFATSILYFNEPLTAAKLFGTLLIFTGSAFLFL